MDEWPVINEQIQRNKIPRINWKAIFGHTLTGHITLIKEHTKVENRVMCADLAYNLIKGQLLNLNINNEELFRRLKINVYARFGEQNSYAQRTKK